MRIKLKRVVLAVLTLIVVFSIGFITACGDTKEEKPNNGKVTDVILPVITLNNSSSQIYMGQSLNIDASVTYDGANVPEAKLVYASDNSNVATVNNEGVVTGVKKGTANITVDCTYNGKVATQKTVQVSIINLTIVSFNTEDKQTLYTGNTLSLSAEVTKEGKQVIDPDIVYTASNSDVVSIDNKTGVLTANSAIDNLVITATYMDGTDPVSDNITLSIDYSVAFTGSVDLSPAGNSGDFFIKTDREFASAKLNGSALNLTPVAEGYNLDTSLFNLDIATQKVVLTDENGIDYIANIYTTIKEVNDDVVKIRKDKDSDYERYGASIAFGENNLGRTDIAHISGNPQGTWHNAFYIEYSKYLEKGYRYLAYDLVFVRGGSDFMGVFGSDGGSVEFTIGSPVEDDEFAVYDLGHNKANFAENEWQTVIIKLESFVTTIEHYAYGGMNVYIDNVRFMSDGAYQDYIDNTFEIIIPDKVEISLDNATVKPGSDYKLVRSKTPVTYQGKTAISFTGTNAADWTNNLIINVGFYKKDYKWILVDFYFNSDSVQFTYNGTNSYTPLTYGKSCDNGSFYVVSESNGVYYSVPALKNQWITIAFRTSDLFGNNIDGIMSSAVNTYVANIRAVKDTIFDEITPLPDTLSISLDNADVNHGSDYKLVRSVNPVTYQGKTAISFTGANDSDWKNNLMINVGIYKADYKWVLVDFYFNSDSVQFTYNGTNSYTPLTYGKSCDNGSFYVVSEVGGTYYSVSAIKNQWITIAFRISDLYDVYINGIMSSAVNTYVANIRVVKESVLDEISSLPDTLNIPLDSANVNNGSDYSLVRDAEPATYEGKTAIGFSSVDGTAWHNNLLIDVGAYKGDYKWVLVDFYLNSNTVDFTKDSASNYSGSFSYGEYCNNGSFYVVSNIEGTYYSVPAAKGQWITIAFRTSDLSSGKYVNGYMSSDGKTYVSNIKMVKSSVIDEISVLPA